MFFDERFTFVPEASQQLRVLNAGNGVAPLVLSNIRVPKNGYVMVFLSNESEEPVFFDDFKVRHDHGRILEENHYYAYGLKIAALSSKAFGGAQNNYQYQGDYSEFDDDLGWNDFMLRSYDPQLGRFLQHDPYDQFSSGYVGMGNDPGNMVDPSGGWGVGGNLTAQAVISGASGGVVVVPTAAQLAASAARKTATNAAKARKLINAVSIIADGVKDLAANSLDFFMGAVTAVVDNQSHGLINRREINGESANDKSAYNQGQDFGDGVLNPLLGLFEIQTGLTWGVGGLVAAPESGGLSLSATAAGAGMVTQGVTSIRNGYQNLSDQKGRVYSNTGNGGTVGSRRANRIPDKGEPNSTGTNNSKTTVKKYGPDGNVQKEYNKGHQGQNVPKNERTDHIHDYKPMPQNPTGRGQRMPGRPPKKNELKKDFGL